MKIIKPVGLGFCIIALAICLSVSVSFAEETPTKPEGASTENKVLNEKDLSTSTVGKSVDLRDWRITLGGTYAKPKLTKANRDVHAVESQLRQIAPTIEKFEDWDDIYKGTIGIGISRKVDIKGLKLWPDFFAAFGTGSIQTKQSGVPTIYTVPMNYSFKQTYEFYQFNLGAFAELFDWKGFSATLGGYLTYGLLGAYTDFSTNIPAAGSSRYVKGDFWEDAFGFAAVCNLYYEFSFLKGFGVSAALRYDWLKFKGPTKVDDFQRSPAGTAFLNYKQDSVSDMTGPSGFFGIFYRF